MGMVCSLDFDNFSQEEGLLCTLRKKWKLESCSSLNEC